MMQLKEKGWITSLGRWWCRVAVTIVISRSVVHWPSRVWPKLITSSEAVFQYIKLIEQQRYWGWRYLKACGFRIRFPLSRASKATWCSESPSDRHANTTKSKTWCMAIIKWRISMTELQRSLPYLTVDNMRATIVAGFVPDREAKWYFTPTPSHHLAANNNSALHLHQPRLAVWITR